MRKGRRIISFILLLAMFASVIPMEYIVSAAPNAIYELDTDGIDAGAEYLIVKGDSYNKNFYALQGADSTNPGATSKVQLEGNQVVVFDGVENYLWTMEDNGDGTYNIRQGDKYLHLTQYHEVSLIFYKEAPAPEAPIDLFVLYQQQIGQLFKEVRSRLEETE